MTAPLPSPTPAYDQPSETPSGSYKVATVREALTVADMAVAPIKAQTQAQWVLIGGGSVGVGGFLAWALISLASVQGAQAQTKAETTTHAAAIVEIRKTQADTSARLGTVERSTIRIETMLEMSLRAQGVRPPPKQDGGE